MKKEEVFSTSSSDRPKLADAYKAAHPLTKPPTITLGPLPTLSALLQRFSSVYATDLCLKCDQITLLTKLSRVELILVGR